MFFQIKMSLKVFKNASNEFATLREYASLACSRETWSKVSKRSVPIVTKRAHFLSSRYPSLVDLVARGAMHSSSELARYSGAEFFNTFKCQ